MTTVFLFHFHKNNLTNLTIYWIFQLLKILTTKRCPVQTECLPKGKFTFLNDVFTCVILSFTSIISCSLFESFKMVAISPPPFSDEFFSLTLLFSSTADFGCIFISRNSLSSSCSRRWSFSLFKPLFSVANFTSFSSK